MFLDTQDIQILSILSMKKWKNGKQIREDVEKDIKEPVSIGVLYNRLDQLEKNSLIEAREVPNTDQLYEFRLLDTGKKFLEEELFRDIVPTLA